MESVIAQDEVVGASAPIEAVTQNETPVPVAQKIASRILAPNKWSFLGLGNPAILILTVMAIAVGMASPPTSIIPLVLAAIAYGLAMVTFKKETYELGPKSIIFRSGTIFSDKETAIEYRKITRVRATLGFFQNHLFKTGQVYLDTAGGSGKVSFKHVDLPMELYEEIRNRMKENGFSLKKDQLVQEAQPHLLGTLGESGSWIGGNLFLLYLTVSWITSGEGGAVMLGFGTLALLLARAFVTFLDLRDRRYELYADSIFYSEGFLNKHYAFVPMESVAETENSQSVFSKFLGIHDVEISSEGASNKIYFHNLVNGKKMLENIKYLKDHFHAKKWTATEAPEGMAYNDDGNLVSAKEELRLDYDESFTGSYKGNLAKAIVGSIIVFPALPYVVIRTLFTTYSIGKNTVEMQFNFISTKQQSFSCEKITKIEIIESWLDKMFGTCSISFVSIGSTSTITFSGIKKEEGLYEKILAKVGIRETGNSIPLPISFTFSNYLKANILKLAPVALLLAGLLIVGSSTGESSIYLIVTLIAIATAAHFAYSRLFYSEGRYRHLIYQGFLSSMLGIIIKTRRYAIARNIKSIKSEKYPLTSAGDFVFEISGELVQEGVDPKKQGLVAVPVSNSISASYVENCHALHDDFDSYLNNQNAIDQTVVAEKRQELGNSLLPVVIIVGMISFVLFLGSGETSVLFPILALWIIVVGLTVWNVKTRRYVIDKSRALAFSGIIIKVKESILLSKINFAEQDQGFVNKLFWNGNVYLFTKGGGGRDMSIINIAGHSEFFAYFRKS